MRSAKTRFLRDERSASLSVALHTLAGVGAPLEAAAESANRDLLMAEYTSMAANVSEQRERAERLQGLADDARIQAEAQEAALRELGELVGIDSQLRLEQLDSRLGGQRLQEIAVQVLADRDLDGPIHYKDWYRLLREAGYVVSGKDPQATFLSSVSRSPHVRSVGNRTGLYVVTNDDHHDGDAATAA